MSEKRFILCADMNWWEVKDNGTGKTIYSEKVVDLLNEQQATNDYLEESNSRLQIQLGKTLRLVDEQQATITKLKEEKESWKNIACQDLSKWSIFSNEVSVLHETRDIERFLEKYYEYCADMVMNDE